MKKVLFVCGQECILNQSDGGKKCSYRNYIMLQEVYGANNVYARIYTNLYEESSPYIQRKKSHTSIIAKIKNVLMLHPFYSYNQERELLSYIVKNNFDIVFFERSMFGTITKKLKKIGIVTQVFVHNIEKNYIWNKVKNQNIAFLLPYISTKCNEKLMFKYVDDIICLTPRDKNLVKEMYRREVAATIPMTFQDVFSEKKMKRAVQDKNKHLLFIGSNFGPNYNGIKWFIENVMAVLTDITLYIVGKDFEKNAQELERKNVRVVGTVDDLSQYYYANCAMVMPILYGDGMKIKTAEAMMYGKIIFASDEALAGYEVSDIAGIYRCNTAKDYIEMIKKLFINHQFIGYSNEVRQCFLEKYCNSNAVKLYKNYLYKGARL